MDRNPDFTEVLRLSSGATFALESRRAARSRRPFSSRDDLYAALCNTVRQASGEEKLALPGGHPRPPSARIAHSCVGKGTGKRWTGSCLRQRD